MFLTFFQTERDQLFTVAAFQILLPCNLHILFIFKFQLDTLLFIFKILTFKYHKSRICNHWKYVPFSNTVDVNKY